jgi:hypothetical protein
MKHICRVSKRIPALAADSGPLTNFNKATPGLLGFNELGDIPLWLGTVVDNSIPVLSGLWVIMPSGISKSGNGRLD